MKKPAVTTPPAQTETTSSVWSAGNTAAAAPSFDAGEALRFLEHLELDPARVWFRSIKAGVGANTRRRDPKRPGWAGDLHGFDAAELAADARDGSAIYFITGHADTASGKDKNGSPTGCVTDADVHGCTLCYAEWDDKPVQWQIEAWRQLGLPEPSAIVPTGGRSAHLHWRLAEALAPAAWKDLQQRLQAFAEADKLDNPSRLMRLPGSPYFDKRTRQPTGTAAAMLHAGPQSYRLNEIEACIPQLEPELDLENEARDLRELVDVQWADLPPRPLEALREALLKVPPFAHDEGKRKELMRLALRVWVEVGERDKAMALLRETCAARITDLHLCFTTPPSRLKPGAVWGFLNKLYGIDISRTDLKGRRPPSRSGCGVGAGASTHRTSEQEGEHQGRGDQQQRQQQKPKPERLTRQQAAERLRDAHRDGVADVALRLLISELSESTGLYTLEIDKLSEAARKELEGEQQQEREQDRLRQERDRQELAAGITLSWLLPPQLADALATTTQHLPYDDRVVAVAWLAAMAGLTKVGTTVNGNPASGYTVPMNLFIAIVGDTGKMKSPLGKAVVVNPTEPLKLELAREHSRAMERWQEECRGVKPADRPPPPYAARIRVNSYTGESLTAMLQELEARGLALLVYRDELAGLFGSLNAYRKGDDEEQLLELWDGGGTSSLRVKDGGRHFNRSHVSIYGSIQPAVLSRLVSGDDSNGKWARFLFCPLPNITRALPEAVSPEEEQAQRRAEATLQQIASKVFTLPPAEYRLTPDALAWFSRYHLQKQEDGQAAELGPQKALHGKGAGKVLRVAGLLHVAARVCAEPPLAEPHAITINTLKKAITLVDTLDLWASGFHAEAAAEAAGGIGCFMRKIHNLSADNRRGWIGWRDVSRKLSGTQRKHLNREAFVSAVCRLAADKHGESRPAHRGGTEYRAASGPI